MLGDEVKIAIEVSAVREAHDDDGSESRRTGRPVPDYPTSALEPGTTAPDFKLKSTPDQSVRPGGLPRPRADHGVLSGRLEPGLHRSDGALQRDPAGVQAPRGRRWSASRSTTPGATWRSRAAATCTSRCSPTSTPRARSRRRTASTTTHRDGRAGAVRRRRGGHRSLELCLPDRRQSWRGRNPRPRSRRWLPVGASA